MASEFVSHPSLSPPDSNGCPAAYFSQQKLDQLNTIDDVPGVGDVPVPDGWFRSARRDAKARRDDDLPKPVPAKQFTQFPIDGELPSINAVQSGFQSTFYASNSNPSPFPAFSHFPSSSQLDLPEVESKGGRKTAYTFPSSTHGSSGHPSNVRQTAHSIPNVVPAPIQPQYRDVMPSHSRSACPSSPSSSSSELSTPSPGSNSTPLSEQLVPLEYLQGLAYPRREPIDEQFLQRFTTQIMPAFISKGGGRSHSHTAGHTTLRSVGCSFA